MNVIIYEVLSGSHSYGLDHPGSDKDIRGIFIPSPQELLGFGYKETREYKPDKAYHSLRKYLHLALQANPSILAWLWVRPEFILQTSSCATELRLNRKKLLSRRCRDTFGGYAISQLKKMEASVGQLSGYAMHGERNATADLASAKAGYDCFAEDETEFLTEHGWLRFDDIKTFDKIATIKIRTGELEFQKSLARIDRIYSGKMYILDLRSSRAVVTPGHNLLVSVAHRSRANQFSIHFETSRAEWKLHSMNEILTGRRSVFHTRRAPSLRTEDFPIDDNYLSLAGLYIADGTSSFSRKGGKFRSIRFTQSKISSRVYKIAERLCRIFPIQRYDYDKEIIWILFGPVARSIFEDFGHGSKKKHLPSWTLKLSNRQVEIFWASLLAGDGTDKLKNQVYYTSNKALADDIQAMLVSAGLSSVVYGPYISSSSYGICISYHVVRSKITGPIQTLYAKQILRQDKKQSGKEGHAVKEIYVQDKRVVCFEVPNGTLITRSKGKVAIHGNCKNALHLIRILRCGIALLERGDYELYREYDREELLAIRAGKWRIEEVIKEAEDLRKVLDFVSENSCLPWEPDKGFWEDFLVRWHWYYLAVTEEEVENEIS